MDGMTVAVGLLGLAVGVIGGSLMTIATMVWLNKVDQDLREKQMEVAMTLTRQDDEVVRR